MPSKRSKRLRQSEAGTESNLSDSSNTPLLLNDNLANNRRNTMDLSMYEELSTRCSELEQRCATLTERYERLLQSTNPQTPNISPVTPPTIECVINREDSVPKFKAEVSAAFPLEMKSRGRILVVCNREHC